MNVMGLALFLIMSSPVFASAQSLKEIRIGSTDITVSNFCSFYARDRKFFEAEGFDMKMVIIKTEAALAAMAAGDLDYSTLSTSSVEGTLKGLPLRLLAVTNRYPLLGLVVRKGINNVADLKGKKTIDQFFRRRGLRRIALLAQKSRPAAEGRRDHPGRRNQFGAHCRAQARLGGRGADNGPRRSESFGRRLPHSR
ncbi:MAG: ABC transporter substrate-binding protein [Candidatus Binatia bacterium]